MPDFRVIEGDTLAVLPTLEAGSARCCITSPPYFGLRDYGHDGQIGLEPTPGEYVETLVSVFREVRRVLSDDGTLWLNLGDSYCAAASGSRGSDRERARTGWDGGFKVPSLDRRLVSSQGVDRRVLPNIKQKDLIGIPWMVAFALRADGWYLRSDIIWAKPNPMPESVTDRPTRSHEYVFLLSKSARYFYDAAAIREEGVWAGQNRTDRGPRDSQMPSAPPHRGIRNDKQRGHGRRHAGFNDRWDSMTREEQTALGRNKRSVWTVPTQPFPGAHFATFPPSLIEPCVLAGSEAGDMILDPFNGAGTTGIVALRNDRHYLGIEINPDYAQLARHRIYDDGPLLNEEKVA